MATKEAAEVNGLSELSADDFATLSYSDFQQLLPPIFKPNRTLAGSVQKFRLTSAAPGDIIIWRLGGTCDADEIDLEAAAKSNTTRVYVLSSGVCSS